LLYTISSNYFSSFIVNSCPNTFKELKNYNFDLLAQIFIIGRLIYLTNFIDGEEKSSMGMLINLKP